MSNKFDFIEWAKANGHGKTEVPMNLMYIILDFQNYVESEVKNLHIQNVKNWRFFDEPVNNRIIGFAVGLIIGVILYACF